MPKSPPNPPSTVKPAGRPKLARRPNPSLPPIHPFDRNHGTDTSGLIAAKHLRTGHPHDQHVTAYYGVAPSILRTLIDLWLDPASAPSTPSIPNPHPPSLPSTFPPPAFPIDRYTFLDIGAGKGRALLVASEIPFLEVLGVELNPHLASIARSNIALFEAEPTTTSLAPIRLLEQDATTLVLPRTPILAFLFHPFEAPVLEALLRTIETQLANRPDPSQRTLDLLYVNDECASTLDRNPAFTRLFQGPIPMSTEDHLADLAAIADQKEYGSTGDEQCALYRYTRPPHAVTSSTI